MSNVALNFQSLRTIWVIFKN